MFQCTWPSGSKEFIQLLLDGVQYSLEIQIQISTIFGNFYLKIYWWKERLASVQLINLQIIENYILYLNSNEYRTITSTSWVNPASKESLSVHDWNVSDEKEQRQENIYV